MKTHTMKGKIITLILSLTACVLFYLYTDGNNQRLISKRQPLSSPQYEGWRLIARSDAIAGGRLIISANSIQNSIDSRNYKYETAVLSGQQMLKGEAKSENINFQFYTEPNLLSPNPNGIIGLDSKKSIAFLADVSEDESPELYLLDDSKSLMLYVHEIKNNITSEVENQNRIVESFNGSRSANPDEMHEKVLSLVEEMLDKKTEIWAFDSLEILGKKAVPSIIRLMDDRRPLPIKSIKFTNKSASSLEGVRHYSPELICDALSAILNQVTGENFGSIQNGGSERERVRTINGWRIYLHYSTK